jgi:L-fuconolactonase
VEFSLHPNFVGVRHVVQDESDDFLLLPEFQRGLGALKKHRLVYDLLVYPRHLPSAIRLVREHPEQVFVLDHLGKPPIRSGVLSPWRGLITQLAQAPNVFCKVSGLVTEADHQAWTPGELRPYLDVAFEAFGSQRLMFGSDWPVCLLAASYGEVKDVLEEYTSRLAVDDRAAIFGGNAERIYRIAPTGSPQIH